MTISDLLEQNKMSVESKGYEVVIAENAIKDGNHIQREKPDAAVVDLIMEEHDSGFILSYKIKKDNTGKIFLFLF